MYALHIDFIYHYMKMYEKYKVKPLIRSIREHNEEKQSSLITFHIKLIVYDARAIISSDVWDNRREFSHCTFIIKFPSHVAKTEWEKQCHLNYNYLIFEHCIKRDTSISLRQTIFEIYDSPPDTETVISVNYLKRIDQQDKYRRPILRWSIPGMLLSTACLHQI